MSGEDQFIVARSLAEQRHYVGRKLHEFVDELTAMSHQELGAIKDDDKEPLFRRALAKAIFDCIAP